MSSLEDRRLSRRRSTKLGTADLVLVIAWGVTGLLLHAATSSIASAGAYADIPDEYGIYSHDTRPNMGTDVALRAMFD